MDIIAPLNTKKLQAMSNRITKNESDQDVFTINWWMDLYDYCEFEIQTSLLIYDHAYENISMPYPKNINIEIRKAEKIQVRCEKLKRYIRSRIILNNNSPKWTTYISVDKNENVQLFYDFCEKNGYPIKCLNHDNERHFFISEHSNEVYLLLGGKEFYKNNNFDDVFYCEFPEGKDKLKEFFDKRKQRKKHANL